MAASQTLNLTGVGSNPTGSTRKRNEAYHLPGEDMH